MKKKRMLKSLFPELLSIKGNLPQELRYRKLQFPFEGLYTAQR
jgi:hypothetical protein